MCQHVAVSRIWTHPEFGHTDEGHRNVATVIGRRPSPKRTPLRVRQSAHWASWTDCRPHDPKLQPSSRSLVGGLFGQRQVPSESFESQKLSIQESTKDRWQHEATQHVEDVFRTESLYPPICDFRNSLLIFPGKPGACLALLTCSVSRLTQFIPQSFGIFLLRRLHLPLPSAVRNC